MNAPARPNLVPISADQWRGDVLGVAGDPVIHTPGIDAMAGFDELGDATVQAHTHEPPAYAR